MTLLTYLWRAFISRRFAAVLLITLTALLFLGVLLPSISYHEPSEMAVYQQKHPILFALGELFNPPNLAGSWTFMLLNTLLFLSTLFCIIERLRNREYRDPFMTDPRQYRQHLIFKISGLDPKEIMDQASRKLKKSYWQIKSGQSGKTYFLKGEKGFIYGFWGSIVFHIGFLVLILGAIISSFTRFNGSILITEGQKLPLQSAESYVQIVRDPKLGQKFPPGYLTLNKFTTRISDRLVDYQAEITLADGFEEKTDTVKVNKAVKSGGHIFLLENYGFAPFLVVKDKNGAVLANAFINLKGRKPGDKDAFTIPDKNVAVGTFIFPDYRGEPLTSKKTYLLLNINEELKKVNLGEAANLAGFTFKFADLRYWAYFRVTKDDGLLVIFIGFFLGAIGLIARYIFYERRLTIKISPGKKETEVTISGHSRYFPALFEDEVKTLANFLERKV